MSELWGVGTTPDGELLPLSLEDIEHDTAAAGRALDELGITAGQHVLVVSRNSQAGHIWPVLVALVSRGAVYSPVDSSMFEARRFEMYLRRLPFHAVVGLTDEILDGLAELGLDAAEVLAAVPVVLAAPGAAERLRRAGLAVRRLVFLGPALAMDCASGLLHVDGHVWDAQDLDGRLVLVPRQDRAAWPAGERAATGISGKAGIGRCDCGRDGPWLVIEDLDHHPQTNRTV